MYSSASIAANIKRVAKSKGIQIKDMLIELDLSKNALTSMYGGSMIRADSLARIADYLHCSVDSLLERHADAPEVINSGTISNIAVGNHASSITQNSYAEEPDKELITLIHSLPLRERTKVLSYAYELSDKIKTPVLTGTSVE